MSSPRTLILDNHSIVQKIKRIAYQIYEHNYNDSEIVFVAIENKGIELAKRLQPELEAVSELKVHNLSLAVDKKDPLSNIRLTGDDNVLKGKSVILIDDVLNSGKTLIYAARHILGYDPKKLTTVVLVDRRHRLYPIKADFVGLTLSTTLQDHIAVEFESQNDKVYLE